MGPHMTPGKVYELSKKKILYIRENVHNWNKRWSLVSQFFKFNFNFKEINFHRYLEKTSLNQKILKTRTRKTETDSIFQKRKIEILNAVYTEYTSYVYKLMRRVKQAIRQKMRKTAYFYTYFFFTHHKPHFFIIIQNIQFLFL